MSTDQLIILDLAVSVLAAAAWLGAAATATARRARLALALTGLALLASLSRIATVAGLAGGGWWFVQDKVTLTLPALLVTGLIAARLAIPALVASQAGDQTAARARDQGKGGGVDPAGAPAPAPAGGPAVVPVRSPADGPARVPAGSPDAVPVRRGAVLALFVAGYAAAAGPVITLLLGYPVTPSSALIAVAVVGAAAALTLRMLAAGRARAGIILLAAVLGLAMVGAGLPFVPESGVDTGGGSPASRDHHAQATPVTDLHGPATAAEGGTVRRYTLTARTATITLASGRQVSAWTFDGQVPGPAITATEGDLVEVLLRNADIAAGVTVHWHGYDVPAAEDGVPGLTQDAVAPGQEHRYRFRADRVGTYWYHTHEVSDQGVRLGLYGTLIVTPRAPTASQSGVATTGAATTGAGTTGAGTTGTGTVVAEDGAVAAGGLDLALPVHTFGGVSVLGDQDQLFEKRVAPGAPVRLRLINTDNTPQVLALHGSAFRVTAVDGDNLNAPGEVERVRLRIPAGGRYDVEFAMPAGQVAQTVGDDRTSGLRLLPTGGGGVEPVDSTAGWTVLDLLSYGQPAPETDGVASIDQDSAFDRRFTLVLDRGLAMVDGAPAYAQTVNGLAFPSVPSQLVSAGDLVRMTVVNRSQETHPWHLHGHRVLVLSRDGQQSSGSPLWLDTFDIQPGQVWQVAFRADNPGLWMNHCHNLSHADQGMALHLLYDGVTSPFHGGHGG